MGRIGRDAMEETPCAWVYIHSIAYAARRRAVGNTGCTWNFTCG